MTIQRHTAICTVPVFIVGALIFAATEPVGAQTPPATPAGAAAAAPAAPTSLDGILKQVALYDGGIESAAMWQLRDYVYARRDDPAGRAECETKLLAFMRTPASPTARMAACRYLRLIAGDSAVPALQAMLIDEKSADLALYALQGIPGGAAEKALLQGLGVTTGPTKTAIVVALGERRSGAAVAAIAPLLQQPALAPTAAVALGRIGGDAAVAPLKAALGGAAPALKTALAGALLEAASAFVTAKNSAAALAIYEPLAADASLPAPQRRAATLGRIDASGAGARALVTSLVAGTDEVAQQAAIARVNATFSADAIAPVCALLPKIPDGAQIALIAALSAYPADRVVPAFLGASRSSSDAVRLAALRALGQTGGAAQVGFLAERASGTKGTEQAAARTALGSLKGRAVDDEILAQLGRRPSDPIAGELLLAIGDRRIFSAKSTVVSALSSSSATIRLQAFRTLRAVGTPSDIPAVVDALLTTTDETEQGEAEKTVLALSQKIEIIDGRARMVQARIVTEKAVPARARLIGLIGLIGDPSTLPLLRATLRDESPDLYDAAVRALAAWPTPAAREDLMTLARDARAEAHRLLAIRGAIRLIGLETYRDPRAAVADLRLAAGFAWRPDEYRLVLSALTRFPGADAMEAAREFLRDPEVSAEAKAAVNQISSRLQREAGRK
jgi:HEAT repeat protein